MNFVHQLAHAYISVKKLLTTNESLLIYLDIKNHLFKVNSCRTKTIYQLMNCFEIFVQRMYLAVIPECHLSIVPMNFPAVIYDNWKNISAII